MYYKSIDDLHHAVLRGLPKIPRDVDLIAGIPRSGLLAANMLSLYLNLPLTDLNGLGEKRLLGNGKRPIRNKDRNIFESARKILVVDDCVSQGTEMLKAKQKIADFGYADRTLFGTIYSFPEKAGLSDIVFETVPRPMCFQWSCMHSKELAYYCVDIDGVLCVDPTPDQDDDGENYCKFLQNAIPLFTPTVEIGWLVTCRIERYRQLTEQWLKAHGISYRNLVMMDHSSKEERTRANAHASYKAEVYRKSGARLFIESSQGLASKIADLSGLPVMCLGTGEMIRKPASERLDILTQRAESWIRRIRRIPSKFVAIAK